MDKKEILAQIEQILPKLYHYQQYKEVSFESGELAVLKQVSKAILPNRILTFTCSPCVGELITIVLSYYERESQNN